MRRLHLDLHARAQGMRWYWIKLAGNLVATLVLAWLLIELGVFQ